MHIWLIGMMGSGKSVVGRAVARRLNLACLDLDDEIEKRARASIASIFRTRGEASFRALEREAISSVSSRKTPCVVATGGGAVLDDWNVAAMRRSGRVVWLDAPVATLAARVSTSQGTRPLLAGANPRRKLRQIFASRSSRYALAADARVDGGTGTPAAVADRVVSALRRPIEYRAGAESVRILVESRVLASAGALVREVAPAARSAFVVTDTVVGPLHARALARALRTAGFRVEILQIRPGERSKNLRTVAWLWEELVRRGIDRRTPIVALGGGVVGDLAGFVGATVLRGVPVIQVPTTLLAQVDSAIGGKTGFDLPAGKNLVGAFKQPARVLIDPSLLRSLPAVEIRAGMGEVVKYACIRDERMFAELETLAWPLSEAELDRVIHRCAAIKAEVIERDPHERGERIILNFGHTVGHAVEAATGYRVRHGEAVAIGMVSEAAFAASRGLCAARDVERLRVLLRRIGLPTESRRRLSRFVSRDKKRQGRVVVLPLLEKIGKVRIQNVSLSEFVRAVET